MPSITPSAVCSEAGPRKLEVLTINNNSLDCAALRAVISRTNWVFHCVSDLPGAVQFLKKHFVPVVVCARDLEGASWNDVIDAVRQFPNPPEVLVYTDQPNAAFCLGVLDSGGFEVLAMPFDRDHVLRSVSLACRKWKDDAHALKRPRHAASAA